MSIVTSPMPSRHWAARYVPCAARAVFASTAAVIWLTASSTLAQTAPPSPPTLQSLVNDTAAQFQLAYRHDAAEHRRRYDELAQLISAWRLSPRSPANNQLLADWLRTAMRSSMPGSREPLPPLPNFELPTVAEALNDAAAFESPASAAVSPVHVDDSRPDQVPESLPDAVRANAVEVDTVKHDATTFDAVDAGEADATEPEKFETASVAAEPAQPDSIQSSAMQPETIAPPMLDKATGDPFVDDPF